MNASNSSDTLSAYLTLTPVRHRISVDLKMFGDCRRMRLHYSSDIDVLTFELNPVLEENLSYCELVLYCPKGLRK